MNVNELVLAQGLRDTRGALDRWRAEPGPVLRAWAGGSLAVASLMLVAVLAIASMMLVAVLAIASNAQPDLTHLFIPGLSAAPHLGDMGHILLRNSLVLALHATACVAGFIAGSSLVLSAEKRTGVSRWIHEKARPIALGWVALVTMFSLTTQTYALGLTGAQLANQLDISPNLLVLTVLPHALPELVALFLPLAAWTIASRRDEWGDLLAATFVTVAIAVPVLIAAAAWESYVWPHLLQTASPIS